MTQQTPWSPQQPQWGQQNPPPNSSGAPPQVSFGQPQWGQFQPQPPPYYPLPPSKQPNQRPWYKKQGILIALVCSLFLLVLLVSYGVTTILVNGQAPTPAATATPSGQLTAASPTAQPTLAPTSLPTPTSKVQVTPTAALTPTLTPKPKPTMVKIKVYNSGFSPPIITIPVGSTVIWTNDGGIAHTVTDDHKAFDSGNLPSGATFQFTFTKRGTYHYVCTYHPNMVGTISVM